MRYTWFLKCFLGIMGLLGTKATVGAQSTSAYQQAYNELSQTVSEDKKIPILLSLGESYLFHAPDSSLKYAKLALKLALKHHQKIEMGRSYKISGKAFYQQGAFMYAITDLQKALDVYASQKYLKEQAEVLQDLGLAYQYAQKPEPQLALEKYQKALDIYTSLQDKAGVASTLSGIGHIFEKKAELDKALTYQQKALKIYQEIQDKRGLAKVLEAIGSIYEDWKEYDKAREYFDQALQHNTALDLQTETITNLNNIGDIYQKEGKLEESLAYFFKSLALAQKINQKYQLRSVYRDIAQTYSLLKDYPKAYRYLDSSYAKYGEVYNTEIARQIAGLQVIYEMQEKDKEIAILENQQRLDRILLYTFTIGAVLLGLLGFVIVNRQRLLLRKNKKILEQNKLLYDTERELQHTAVENLKLKEQKLQDELAIRNRELTSRTLTIVQKNEILGEILTTLNITLKKKETDREAELKKLIKVIEQTTQSNKDWNEFQLAFEQVHSQFFTRLGESFPELTSGDLRLCALMRLNMSTQDIATTLGISQDSLRVNRHRLRKKLNLQQNDSITHFIMSV